MNKYNLNCLPSDIVTALNNVCLLPYHNHIVDMIINGKLPFGGSQLITGLDLQGLYGSSPSSQGKYLSNFIIDEYLRMLSIQPGNLKVEVLTWEEFERSVGNKPAHAIVQGKADLLDQDLILVPCNRWGSQHWLLLAVYPKQRSMVILDSLVGDGDKPAWHWSFQRMMALLK
jgi:hypothetical protein